METWRGVGHSFPQVGSTGLKEWLALQVGREPDLEEFGGGVGGDYQGGGSFRTLVEFE